MIRAKILLTVGLVATLLKLQNLQAAPAASDTVDPPPIEDLENYYNGIDINDPNAEAKTRNAVNSKMQRWPNRTLSYVISKDYNAEEANNVRSALQTFNQATCLTFEERTAEDVGNQRYIHYKKSPKYCGTQVGYNPAAASGSSHDVMLTPQCLSRVGIIQHESLHVLGLYHEQSRYDRDRYIRVIFPNIPPKFHTQFVIYPPIYTRTFNVPYDYKSLMHYSANAFALDPTKPSMRAIDAQGRFVEQEMGQTDAPSAGDLEKINLMYDCI